ncbi:hypothetical protein ACVWXO_000235 [Bradyrhizobium sp. LM2.7]
MPIERGILKSRSRSFAGTRTRASASWRTIAIPTRRLMCAVLEISPAGYYAWREGPDRARRTTNAALLTDIRQVHQDTGAPGGQPTGPCRAAGTGTWRQPLPDRKPNASARHRRHRGPAAPLADSRHGLPIAPNLMIATLGPQQRSGSGSLTSLTFRLQMAAVPGGDHGPLSTGSELSVRMSRFPWVTAIVVRGSAAIGIVIGPSRRAAAALGLRRVCERARADVFRDESGVLAEPIARSLDVDNNCVVKQATKQCCGRFEMRIIAPLS